MPVHSYSLAFAVLYDRVGGGAAPMLLRFRGFRIFPVFFRIPKFAGKPGPALLHFKVFPVKRDRRRVEQAAVKRAVLGVEGFVSKLVEIKYVRAEYKIVGNLLYLYLRFFIGAVELYRRVGFAVGFYVAVYLFLNLGIYLTNIRL